ncbi:Hypothetical protein LEPBI_I2434 [Leptospira biflexa serovar Patoc strain 'Patoc 1 (Paris)']|uniref:Uncharacterized protein n=1 Tax=Leptospira biflexa serovar Patoc (strain Patoc 1 / ATCC 23582 / Paris) TaxID=456481 RepID=B0SLD7_LEPBP|nr:Hypothetical protein LEPBI_I2434 [Leptospira biflexa serovar Patoc strain 'Patoc 1 (Paris)']
MQGFAHRILQRVNFERPGKMAYDGILGVDPLRFLPLNPGRQAKFTKLGKKIRKRYTKWH